MYLLQQQQLFFSLSTNKHTQKETGSFILMLDPQFQDCVSC